MSVRAKFVCINVNGPTAGTSVGYSFTAAIDGDENKSWAKYTPAGVLSITIDNPTAQIFEKGKSYFLDFTPAP